MIFLNPILLLALPLIGLPILIHLINQRRHRTIDWGAMMFLLTARKMSKGMARLRHWAIMAARMLVMAGLIFGIARPLATGWFGALAGGKPETVIVLLDRSASMQQQKFETGETKISAAINKVVDMIGAMDGTKRLVLIESTTSQPTEVSNAKSLLELPKTEGTDSESDIPQMVQAALDYISENATGRTDIWICSDARKNDWDFESSRWAALRSGFSELEGVRLHVLDYSASPVDNLAIKIESAKRVESPSGPELVLDIIVKQSGEAGQEQRVPVEITINGTRSVVSLSIDSEETVLAGHRIPLDAESKLGWGKVELPADSNNSDNVFYFAFAEQAVRQTVIVSDDPRAVDSLQIVCSVSSDPNEKFESKTFTTDQLGEINWSEVSLLLWHAPLPQGRFAKQVESFINSGRVAVFFPPDHADDSQFKGVSWADWENVDETQQVVDFWQNEEDLLRKTLAGAPLPVDELRIYQCCGPKLGGRVLARLGGGQPLLTRKQTDAGGAYFCSTLPLGTHSSLARNGVVIYAMLHRALVSGAASVGAAKQFAAGSKLARRAAEMKSVSSRRASTLAEDRPFVAGVYGSSDQYIAINRPSSEAATESLTTEQLGVLFEGLDFHVIEDKLGSERSLASEVWKLFIVLMGLALLAEVIFCLPPKLEPKIENEAMRAVA